MQGILRGQILERVDSLGKRERGEARGFVFFLAQQRVSQVKRHGAAPLAPT